AESRALFEPLADGREHAALRLHRAGEGRELPSTHHELPLENLVLVFEEATRRRPRGPRAILVVDPAVTRTHEQTRLGEPAYGTAEVRTVDREDLESVPLAVAHPARGVGRGAIPLHALRVAVDRQASLPLGEVRDRARLDPRPAAHTAHRRREESDHRNSHERSTHHVEREPELEQE